MSIQKMSLYRFDWQLLRINLNFKDVEDVERSISTLIQYLEMYPEDYDTVDNKLYRVLNLLNATLMGQNGQKKRVKTQKQLEQIDLKDELVRHLRDQVAEEYHATKGHKFAWDEVTERLHISMALTAEINMVLDSLKARSKFATKSKGVDVYKTRPELVKYIVMLKDELKQRE